MMFGGRLLKAAFACVLAAASGPAETYYVSAGNASGSADGTLASPYPAIKQAADRMQAGDSCLIMSGVYRETIIPKADGTPGDPLVFMAYNNENVFISAGELIRNWSPDQDKVYKAAISWDLGMGRNQIFADGAMMYEARVPNIDAVAGSATDGNIVRNAPVSYVPAGLMNPGFISAGSEKGGGVLKVWIGTAAGAAKVVPFFDSCRVANAPDDFLSGAMVHKTGSYWSSFTGTVAPGWGIDESGEDWDGWMYVMVNAPNWESGGGKIAFIGKRYLLDAQKEWVIEDNTIYFRPPEDKDPNDLYVEAKKRMLVIDLRGRNYVEFRGLNFLGGSVTMDRSNNCVFDNCHFRYITHWTLHHNYQMRYRYNGESAFFIRGNNNRFINSSLEFSAASGLYIIGGGNLVDNCLIHDCDYLGTYDVGIATGDTTAGTNTVSHNTMYNFGRSAWTLTPGSLYQTMAIPQKIVYNEIYNCMFMVDDGGSVYLAGNYGGGTEIAYNWMYNMVQPGNNHHVYYDWGGGYHSIIHHNVFWQDSSWMSENNALTQTPMRHVVYNNTSLQSPWSAVFLPYNDDERGVNALWADGDYGGWGITDYPNRNFELMEGSKAIDKGTFRADSQYLHLIDFPDFVQECYMIDTPVVIPDSAVVGDAPDQGAYEFGKTAWKPGHDWGEVAWVYPPDSGESIGLNALRAERLPPQCKATATHVMITMPDGAEFDVRVMDLAGRTVALHHADAGRKFVAIPAHSLPATVVLVRVSSGDLIKTFRRLIVR